MGDSQDLCHNVVIFVTCSLVKWIILTNVVLLQLTTLQGFSADVHTCGCTVLDINHQLNTSCDAHGSRNQGLWDRVNRKPALILHIN